MPDMVMKIEIDQESYAEAERKIKRLHQLALSVPFPCDPREVQRHDTCERRDDGGILIYHCAHCGAFGVEVYGRCPCGAEWHPIPFVAIPGRRFWYDPNTESKFNAYESRTP